MGAAAAAVQMNNDIKKAVYIRELLNSKSRNFAYSKDVQKTYMKEFNAVKHDIRLMNFARDVVGAISDCYILYAVAMMGVCDIESIMLFLRVLSNKNKDLAISDMRNHSAVKERIDSLVSNGFLFKHRFEYRRDKENGHHVTVKINLYSIEKSAQHMIAQKLGARQLTVNEWIDAKPLSELMGWAACGYVRGRIAESGKFIEYKQGVVRTKAIGTVVYPGETRLKGKHGEALSVAFIQGYMRHNKAIQTKEQYEDACLYTINTIKQYFYVQDQRNKDACVVVVVEDNPDLMTAADFIHNSGILANDYDRIFFTGEGVVRDSTNEQLGECFLRLKAVDGGYDFVPVTPPFMA